MKIMRTLMLASLTAGSLGAGMAMAEDGGPTGQDYSAEKNAVARQAATVNTILPNSALHSFWLNGMMRKAGARIGLFHESPRQ